MAALMLEIPEDVPAPARIDPADMEETLRRELAVQLCSRGLLPEAAARRLSGMERVKFDDLLGKLRETEEWSYVDREVEIRLRRAGV